MSYISRVRDSYGNVKIQNPTSILEFGGTTALFPAIQASGQTLNIILADNSSKTSISSSSIIVNSGSSSNPSVTFSADGYTGLFSPNQGSLALSASGVSIIELNNNSIAISATIKPSINNFYSFGSSSNQFKDGYFTGTLSAGSLLAATTSSLTKPALDVFNQGNNNAIQIESSGAYVISGLVVDNTGVAPGTIQIGTARGTINSKTASQNNDLIGAVVFAGWNGTNIVANSAAIAVQATENNTPTSSGGRLILGTTSNGTINPIPRLQIESDGTINPSNDNAYNLGSSSFRIKDGYFAGTVHASNVLGTIQLNQLAQTGATSGQVLAWNGSAYAPTTESAGSVSSVGLSMPAIFNVTNSPITSSGNLTVTINNQADGYVLAGPSSGPSAQPAFRQLLATDIPFLGTTNGAVGISTYNLGDTLYSSATNTLSKLSGNISTVKQYLNQTGNGSVSAAPLWSQIAPADLSSGGAITGYVLTWNGTNYVPSPATSGLSGTGTVNQLPYWTGSNSLSSTSNITYDGYTIQLNSNGILQGRVSTVSNPAFATAGNNTGIYSSSNSNLNITVAGADSINATTTYVRIPLNGSSASPSLQIGTTTPNTGFYQFGGLLQLSFNGINVGSFGSSSFTYAGTISAASGGVSASTFLSAGTNLQLIYSTTPSVGSGKGYVYTKSDGKLYYNSSIVGEQSVGTVTSVGLMLPSIFNVTGSPITTTGSITATLNTQNSNTFFAGPINGSATTPAFRAFVSADFPGNTIAVASLAGTASTSGYVLTSTGSSSAPTWQPAAGGGGSGTVTSVGLTDGSANPIYNISNSPITASGNIIFSLNTQTANQVFASPNGTSGQPLFRTLNQTDLPVITSLGTITTGVWNATPLTSLYVPALSGLSGSLTLNQISTAGAGTNQVIQYNGTSVAWGNAGTVSSVALSMPSYFAVSGSPITTSGTLNVSLNTQPDGYALIGPSSGSPAAPSFRALVASDIPSISLLNGSLTLAQISTSGATTNQVIQYNGTSATWATITAGINQLTGDVTAGPGSGSVIASVASVGGSTAVNVNSATTKVLAASTSGYVLTANGTAGGATYQPISTGSSFSYVTATATAASFTTNTKYTLSSGSVVMTLAAPTATTNKVAFQVEGTAQITINTSSAAAIAVGINQGTASINNLIIGQGTGGTGASVIILVPNAAATAWIAETITGYVGVN